MVTRTESAPTNEVGRRTYTTALKNRRFNLMYIDTFAGSSLISIRDDRREFPPTEDTWPEDAGRRRSLFTRQPRR